MKRNEFKQVIKAFSCWKIDKRKGNYILPNGDSLSNYLRNLTNDLLERNELAIRSNGDIGNVIDGRIVVPFGEDETFSEERQARCIRILIREMLY